MGFGLVLREVMSIFRYFGTYCMLMGYKQDRQDGLRLRAFFLMFLKAPRKGAHLFGPPVRNFRDVCASDPSVTFNSDPGDASNIFFESQDERRTNC